jgi:hypothetical protein
MNSLIIYNGFIAIVLLTYRAIFAQGFNPWFTFTIGCLSIFSFYLHHIGVRSFFRGKTLMNVTNLLGLGYIIVFFQYGIMAPFFPDVLADDFLWYSGENVNSAISLAGACFHLLLMGYCCGLRKFIRRPGRSRVSVNPEDLSLVCAAMPILSIVTLGLFLVNVGREYLQGAYAGSANWTGISKYLFLLFTLVYYLTLGFEIYRAKIQRKDCSFLSYLWHFNKLTLLLTFFFVGFNVYTGDRGPILSTGLILLAGYDFHVRRVGMMFLAVLMFTGGASLYFIGRYRTRDASMSLEERIEKGKAGMEDVKWYEVTGELASSARTLVLAEEVLPEIYPFFNGRIQLGHIVGIIPFSRGVLYRMGFVVGATSSNFFTTILLGPGSTIGVGSSLVADIFVDFGATGCVIIVTCFGYFLGYLEGRSFSTRNIYWVMLHLLVLSESVYWSRGTLLGPMNEIIWSLGLLYFIDRFVIRNTSRLARVSRINRSSSHG